MRERKRGDENHTPAIHSDAAPCYVQLIPSQTTSYAMCLCTFCDGSRNIPNPLRDLSLLRLTNKSFEIPSCDFDLSSTCSQSPRPSDD